MPARPVALVTGGSRGIGRGVCLELARHRYAVAVNYAGNEDAARETVGLLGADAFAVRADVGNAEQRERMVDAVLARWGRIDVLVNNAGITSVGRKDILEATQDSWDRVLAVNLKGPFFLTRRVAHEMLRRGDLVNPAIVNVGSLSAYSISTNRGDYCVSKAGLSMAARLFALRLAEHHIPVYEVRPGIIRTDMTANVKEVYDRRIADGLVPERRWGAPEDVGRVVAALLRGDAPYATGSVITVDGGMSLPRL